MWHIMGAVHLDVLTDLGARSFDLTMSNQDWLDIELETGGIAANLARFAHEVGGVDFCVLAVTGDDTAGQLVLQRLRAEIPGADVRNIVVGSAATGVVVLIHHDRPGAEEPARTVLGPRFSAIDAVRYSDFRDQLRRSCERPVRLIVDGYTLRLDPADWLADLEAMREDGVEVYLELLPHDIWRTFSRGDLTRLVGSCSVVSGSLRTLARILRLDIESIAGDSPKAHADRVCRQLRRLGLPHGGSLVLRYGARNAQYSLRLDPDVTASLWRYGADEYNRAKGNQDRLFLHEVLGIADRLTRERIELC